MILGNYVDGTKSLLFMVLTEEKLQILNSAGSQLFRIVTSNSKLYHIIYNLLS